MTVQTDAENIKYRNYWKDEFGEDPKKLVAAIKACADPAAVTEEYLRIAKAHEQQYGSDKATTAYRGR